MCDFTTPDVYSADKRRARYEWSCCECDRAIEVHEFYWDIRGLWDGNWSNYRTCVWCERQHTRLRANSNDECGAPHGELMVWLLEEWVDAAPGRTMSWSDPW